MDTNAAKKLAQDLLNAGKRSDSVSFEITGNEREEVIVTVQIADKATSRQIKEHVRLGGNPVATIGAGGGNLCPTCGRPM